MKDSCTRDRLAQQHDIICFEMEAAGLMDDLHCLVIRGICDYCDAQKTKLFQDYSALTAAAYAKELLLTIPSRHDRLAMDAPEIIRQEVLDHRKMMMEALDFDEAESRRATVRRAHSQTCKWILTQREYLGWLDIEKLPQHNGLLWVRGKGGCGKSTLIKYLIDNMERQKLSNTVVISFFFNARGGELEKSTIGMYRSLLHQLLKKIPKLQYLLDKISRISSFEDIATLQHLLEKALQELQELSVFCFVDALDECPEDQIQDMVTSFESLGDSAVQNESRWHVCFSSRYYPNISTRACISLELDQRNGHADDIKKYINSELKAGTGSSAEALKAEIAEKSGRIFLWVVLVVRMLKKLFDSGRGNRIKAMRSKLKEIPLELDQLFHDILTRDNNNMAELVLTIQWLLYSQRPLKREELYFAVQSGDDDAELDNWNAEEINTSYMDNYILDCSKGLVELTRSKAPSAQFIHESVREYLIKPGVLEKLWPGSGAISEGKSHHRLLKCCRRYMVFGDADEPHLPEGSPKSGTSARFRRETLKKFPFLGYATQNLLFHADHAAKARLLESSFCYNLDMKRYMGLHNVLTQYKTTINEGNFLILLAVKNFNSLLSLWIRLHPPTADDLYKLINVLVKLGDPEVYKNTFSGHTDQSVPNRKDVGELEVVLFCLLSSVCKEDSHFPTVVSRKKAMTRLLLTPLLPLETPSKQLILNEALCSAALFKDENAVKCLLNAGAQPNSSEGSALQSAAGSPFMIEGDCVRYIDRCPHILVQAASLMRELIQRGAKLQSGAGAMRDSVVWADAIVARIIWDAAYASSPNTIKPSNLIAEAVSHGNLRILPFLLEKGGEINAANDHDRAPVDLALSRYIIHGIGVVKWLIQHGAVPVEFKSPICYIIKTYRDSVTVTEMVGVLLANQSSVNQVDEDGNTPLIWAVAKINLPLVQMLLDYGANGSEVNKNGHTPLHGAVSKDHLPLVQMLLDKGADVNQDDKDGKNPLRWAISGRWAVSPNQLPLARMLLDYGADVYQADSSGETPMNAAVMLDRTDMVQLLHDYSPRQST